MVTNAISEKEANLYLDNTYCSIIYKTKEEFIKVQNELKLIIMNYGKNDDSEFNEWLYKTERSMKESSILFKIASETQGKYLWLGKAWRNAECNKICPWGTICGNTVYDHKFTTIDGEKYCYGQIEVDLPYQLPHDQKYEIMSEVWEFIYTGYIHLCQFENDKKL